MSDHYILRGKEVVPVALMEWADWYENANRHVALDNLPEGVRVSTVFLGLDHSYGGGPPLIFETMIFGGEYDQEQRRYSTWQEAEQGHAEMLKMARRGFASHQSESGK